MSYPQLHRIKTSISSSCQLVLTLLVILNAEMMDVHEMLANRCGKPKPSASFPALAKHYEMFRALPELETYFSSDAYKLPVNNSLGNAYFL